MNFRPFELDHWFVLIFILALALGLVFGARRIRSIRDDRWVRYALALILFVSGLGTWIYYFNQGYVLIPLHLCDLTLVLAIWSLLTRNRFGSTLVFFWGLAANSQAVLTPDLYETFPSYRWLSFFASHGGVVLSAVYLSVRGYVQITKASVWQVWLLSNLYAGIAGLVNWRFGTNFGYLASKPEQPSLFDYMGPWPYYILSAEVMALGLLFLCYAFNRWVDRLASRTSS